MDPASQLVFAPAATVAVLAIDVPVKLDAMVPVTVTVNVLGRGVGQQRDGRGQVPRRR